MKYRIVMLSKGFSLLFVPDQISNRYSATTGKVKEQNGKITICSIPHITDLDRVSGGM
jgi:hypothetical protein